MSFKRSNYKVKREKREKPKFGVLPLLSAKKSTVPKIKGKVRYLI